MVSRASAMPLEALAPHEGAVYRHLVSDAPALADAFLAELGPARTALIGRTLQALVREGLLPGEREEAAGGFAWRLADGRRLTAAKARAWSLGRLELLAPLCLDGEPLAHPLDLVPLLGALEETSRARFERELADSCANYALARVGAERRRAELRASMPDAPSALAYVRARQAADPTFSPLAFYEQSVVEGHPLHPGAKIKLGLTPAEVRAHSPEWGAEPAVALVAIAKAHRLLASLDGHEAKALLFAEHPQLETAFVEALRARGLDPDAYDALPLHPFQAGRPLATRGADALRQAHLVPISGAAIPTRALMSFRSLAPVRPGCHHLKTAVDVQMTNAVRLVSPASAQNGPALSKLFRAIRQLENGFGGRFAVLEEAVGLAYAPEGRPVPDVSAHFAALIRENPEAHAGPGAIAMPGAALVARTPLGEGWVVSELLDAFAASAPAPFADRGETARAWLAQYVRVAAPGFLSLLSRFGISLEGHLQNCVAVFEGGAPRRLLVRDFGGIRIDDVRLGRLGLAVQLAPGSKIGAKDEDDLRNKLFYPFVQNHLGELVRTLALDLGAHGANAETPERNEATLWRAARAELEAAYAPLIADPATGHTARADAAALFAPTLELKAMVRMRLDGAVTDYTFAPVPTPLA